MVMMISALVIMMMMMMVVQRSSYILGDQVCEGGSKVGGVSPTFLHQRVPEQQQHQQVLAEL